METTTMMTFGDVAGGGDDGLTEMRGHLEVRRPRRTMSWHGVTS
jgi:hypothetical protein